MYTAYYIKNYVINVDIQLSGVNTEYFGSVSEYLRFSIRVIKHDTMLIIPL